MTKEQKFLLLVVILVAGVGATLFVENQKEAEEFSQNKKPSVVVSETAKTSENLGSVAISASTTPNAPAQAQPQTKVHKTAVTYEVPEGHTDTLHVTVTLTGGKIADIEFSENPSNRDSAKYYAGFQKAFAKSAFIGKSIDEVSLSRLGGASLTTEAFMDALAAIKKESSS